jgi:thioredoxin-like negative regulator of GroEL
MRKPVIYLIVFLAFYSSLQLILKRSAPKVDWSPVIQEITDETFYASIDSATPWTVVEVWADWCQICKRMKPGFNQVAEQFEGEIDFLHLNGEENEEWVERFRVNGYPTILIFYHGQELSRNAGYMPPEALKSWIEHTSGLQAKVEE